MEILNKQPLKEPKIIGRKPKYTQEYMAMVGRKVSEGEMSYREAGKVFSMSHGTVGVCVKSFKRGTWGNAKKVKDVSERVQVQRLESHLKDLKHEIAELYLENLMLKKALAYSQQIKRGNSSVITSESFEVSREAVE